MTNCLKCNQPPTRQFDDDQNTWLECVPCGNSARSSNRLSDDYAFLNTEAYWDELMGKYRLID